jgi:hypothetical protein
VVVCSERGVRGTRYLVCLSGSQGLSLSTSPIDLEFHQHQHLPTQVSSLCTTNTYTNRASRLLRLYHFLVHLFKHPPTCPTALFCCASTSDAGTFAVREPHQFYLLKPASSPILHAPLTLLCKSLCCRLEVKRVARYLSSLFLFKLPFPPTSHRPVRCSYRHHIECSNHVWNLLCRRFVKITSVASDMQTTQFTAYRRMDGVWLEDGGCGQA